jgi:hypothetical protein
MTVNTKSYFQQKARATNPLPAANSRRRPLWEVPCFCGSSGVKSAAVAEGDRWGQSLNLEKRAHTLDLTVLHSKQSGAPV